VTPPSTWNTRLSPPPLTVTPWFGPVIVSVPVVSLSSSWVPLRVIICGVLNSVLSNLMVSVPPYKFASPTAQRSVIPLIADERELDCLVGGDQERRAETVLSAPYGNVSDPSPSHP